MVLCGFCISAFSAKGMGGGTWGSFSDLGSSLGVLQSLEACPLSPSRTGMWLWLQELPHVISQDELRLCVISFH